jgi:hypothetical protein
MLHIEPGIQLDLVRFYRAHNGRLNMSCFDMIHGLNGWTVWRLVDDEPLAIIITKNGEAHIAAIPGRKVGVKRIKWALDALDVVKTAVTNQFKAGHALAKKLGFVPSSIDTKAVHYVRIPH